MDKELFTVRQVSARYHVCPANIYRRIKDKNIKPIRLSKRGIRLLQEQIDLLWDDIPGID